MSDERDTELRQGARAAAAAAAVGAAVGVARALAARADHAAHRHDAEPAEADASEDERLDVEAEPTPAEQPERPKQPPQSGVGADRLRRLTDEARDVLQTLSGVDVESVSGVDRTGAGWRITLEAVEVRRIPESTDLLATYDVELDDDGDLVRYERRRRYARAQADRGDDR